MPNSENKLMLHKIKEGMRLPLSFAFPKESELIPFFNHFTMKLYETGLLTHTMKKWMPSAKPEPLQNDSGELALPMEAVVFPFAVLVIAGLSTMILVIIEYCSKIRIQGEKGKNRSPVKVQNPAIHNQNF